MDINEFLGLNRSGSTVVSFGNDLSAVASFLTALDKTKKKLPPGTCHYGYNSTPKYNIRNVEEYFKQQTRYLSECRKPLDMEIIITLNWSQRYYSQKTDILTIHYDIFTEDTYGVWTKYYQRSKIIPYYMFDEFKNVFDIDL
jgi:hypothetical protein